MQHLLNQLNSRDPAIRDTALRAARALPPDQLLQLVLLESRNRRKRNKLAWGINTGFTMIGYMIIGGFFVTKAPGALGIAAFLTILMMSLGNIGESVYKEVYNKANKQIRTLLSEVEDARFIAPILRLLFGLSNDEAKELRTAVKRLLPQIRADHAQTWNKEDKAALLLPLKNPDNDKELTIACLKALEQVGDASAIPAVKKLLPKMYPAQWKEGIALAAQECLFYLESNTGRFQQAETLLRASETATRPDILLRPAQSAPDTTPAEQLLRPGE